ncbi:MAG TPA: iron-containing alcohol dehydrogenase [Solirubrobacterales bacterium]|nr:iron-containing alcohol dehydrogenase [Solirubrobacterales bacterium]
MNGNFVWRDAGRTVVFEAGGVAAAPKLLAEHGIDHFELLTTARHLDAGAGLVDVAAAVHELPPADPATAVPESAAALLDAAGAPRLVALGGGRAIDTAKAIAAVTGASVAAIPTTMSGAEMTGIHRLPAGAEDRVRSLVRPALVIADSEAMTSAPEPELRASSMNALAHGADSLYTPFANPVSRMAALRGAELIATSLDEAPAERNRAALAQGSILSGYAIDSAAFSLHHVVCQTLVRICGATHAGVNAAILPRAMSFMTPRAPDRLEPLATAIGTTPESIESRLLGLGGTPPGLGAQGANHDKLSEAIDAMLLRPELAFAPELATRSDLEALIGAAW